MSQAFPHLFESIEIGGKVAPNRVMVPTHTKVYSRDGTDSQRTIDYFAERAAGGAGILFTDPQGIHGTSTYPIPHKSFAENADRSEADSMLTAAIHAHGALAMTQLAHNGLHSSSEFADDMRVVWAPSALKSPVGGEVAKAMDFDDIEEAIAGYAGGAASCLAAGFDGVEVLTGHGYLLHEFLSPLYNMRTDEYGGSWENRTRLIHQILTAIRERVGRELVVGVRMSGRDMSAGGLDIDDGKRLASELVDRGDIDFLNVTGGEYHAPGWPAAPSDVPDGFFDDLGAAIKSVSNAPVFIAGGVRDPGHAERLIAAGKVDVVGVARATIADPEWPNKAREGRVDEITHCIRGNQGCMYRVVKGLPAACTVNPAAGRERLFGKGTLAAAGDPQRWHVVGGGPAGMRAAATLARRGHQVTLLEREAEVGGQVNLILRTPGRDSYRFVIRDLRREMERAGVEIRCGAEATSESLLDDGARRVVVATGARPSRTGSTFFTPMIDPLPGVSLGHVITPWEALDPSVSLGKRAVVLDDDGTRYGAGVSEVLLDRGLDVELVCPSPSAFADTLGTLDHSTLYSRLMSKGLRIRPNSWAVSIEDDSVEVMNLYNQDRERLPGVDTVVLATPREAAADLYLEVKDRIDFVRRVGDCVAPRKIDHAIYEGELAGRELWSTAERFIDEGSLERLRA